jgi:hypothetical protein
LLFSVSLYNNEWENGLSGTNSTNLNTMYSIMRK